MVFNEWGNRTMKRLTGHPQGFLGVQVHVAPLMKVGWNIGKYKIEEFISWYQISFFQERIKVHLKLLASVINLKI